MQIDFCKSATRKAVIACFASARLARAWVTASGGALYSFEDGQLQRSRYTRIPVGLELWRRHLRYLNGDLFLPNMEAAIFFLCHT